MLNKSTSTTNFFMFAGAECRQMHLWRPPKASCRYVTGFFFIRVCSFSDCSWAFSTAGNHNTSEPTHSATITQLCLSTLFLHVPFEATPSDNLWRINLHWIIFQIQKEERRTVGMAERGNPSVYVVDSHVTQLPVPPRPIQNQRRVGAAQTILFLLIGVALCGMTIEACFIYYLYHPGSVSISFHLWVNNLYGFILWFLIEWKSDIRFFLWTPLMLTVLNWSSFSFNILFSPSVYFFSDFKEFIYLNLVFLYIITIFMYKCNYLK